jgi:hypothetical protein
MVWYDKTAIANIFGLSDLKKKHRITFDSEKEDAFIVHMDKGNMKFKCNPKGLYTFEVSNKYLKKESHLIKTVKENRVGYTQRQFEQAKRARELYHIMGMPTIETFKTLIKMNENQELSCNDGRCEHRQKDFQSGHVEPQRQIDTSQVNPGKGRHSRDTRRTHHAESRD